MSRLLDLEGVGEQTFAAALHRERHQLHRSADVGRILDIAVHESLDERTLSKPDLTDQVRTPAQRLDEARDLATARRLIADADFVVESGVPGALVRYGIDYATVAVDNPALVYVSITPFGQTGPRGFDPATDLTVQAAAGVLIEVGNADRPPLRIAGNHSWAHAGAEAAGAALIAHNARQRSGLGQYVDVSAQDATSLANGFASLADLLNASPTRRTGGGIVVGPVEMPVIFPATDGYVSLTFWFSEMQAPYARR